MAADWHFNWIKWRPELVFELPIGIWLILSEDRGPKWLCLLTHWGSGKVEIFKEEFKEIKRRGICTKINLKNIVCHQRKENQINHNKCGIIAGFICDILQKHLIILENRI